jgi:hypothetical protein
MRNLNQAPTSTHPAAGARQSRALDAFRREQISAFAADPLPEDEEDPRKKDFKRMQRLP